LIGIKNPATTSLAAPGRLNPALGVRKVEIHDVYDVKQWFWKGADGIRETTWPGVYNRSRLPGRDDYFPRPDSNCYSLSGKSVTFTLPDEPWRSARLPSTPSAPCERSEQQARAYS
jgi:hypothetical protein